MKRRPYFERPWFWYILAVLVFIVCCEGARADYSLQNVGGTGCVTCNSNVNSGPTFPTVTATFPTAPFGGDPNGCGNPPPPPLVETQSGCGPFNFGGDFCHYTQGPVITVSNLGNGQYYYGTTGTNIKIGCTAPCTQDVHVTAHWAGILPNSASAVVNLDIGGVLVQVQGNVFGFATATMSSAQLNLLGSAPYNVNSAGIMGGSWAKDLHGNSWTPVVVGGYPTSVTCGGTLDIPVSTGIPAPSPTPGATATVSPSASLTPAPSPTAIPTATIPPFDAPQSPLNNSGTTTTGTNGVGISNADLYNDFKQALQDAGKTGMPTVGDQGPTTHGEGDYGNRGHIDDLQGKADQAIAGKTSIVTSARGVLQGYVNHITQLSGQTFGTVSSIPMPFSTLGDAPAVGKVTLPASIDLSPWLTLINALRSCLRWLLIIAFFVLSFRMMASQGATT